MALDFCAGLCPAVFRDMKLIRKERHGLRPRIPRASLEGRSQQARRLNRSSPLCNQEGRTVNWEKERLSVASINSREDEGDRQRDEKGAPRWRSFFIHRPAIQPIMTPPSPGSGKFFRQAGALLRLVFFSYPPRRSLQARPPPAGQSANGPNARLRTPPASSLETRPLETRPFQWLSPAPQAPNWKHRTTAETSMEVTDTAQPGKRAISTQPQSH